jgi:IS1 family transposase
MPVWKNTLSRTVNRVMRLAMGSTVNDMTSGFRVYLASTLREIRFDTVGFAFLPGILIDAASRRFTIVEEPIHFVFREVGESKMQIFSTGLSYLRLFGSKAKNTTLERKAEGWGDTWTWTALDADTKRCVSYLVGGRDAEWAQEFMEDCASRIRGRVQITTDGHRAYLEAVEGAFGMDVDYAQLQKIYGASMEPERQYSPAHCIGCDMKVVSGNPDPKHVSTSFVERQNLSMRMSIRRFTRLTNAFSKKVENHAAAVAIWFMYYNFCCVHQTLRVTPAMEAGISEQVWGIEELGALLGCIPKP